MLFLLVGRTGVGKSHLEQLLETHFHWRFIRSYTDRPKRGPKDTGHTFLSTEKLASFPKEERVAETIIGPYTYFATKEQVAQADGYVIDPNGIDCLLKRMPEEQFHIVYLTADRKKAKEHAKQRGIDAEQEAERFDARQQAEDAEFTHFETQVNSGNYHPKRTLIQKVKNTYEPDQLENLAADLENCRNYYQNMKVLLRTLRDTGILEYQNGKVPMFSSADAKEPPEVLFSEDALAQMILYTHRQSPVTDLMISYLMLPEVRLTGIGTKTVTLPESLKNRLDTMLHHPPFSELLENYPDVFSEDVDTIRDQIWDNWKTDPMFLSDLSNLMQRHIGDTLLKKVSQQKSHPADSQ